MYIGDPHKFHLLTFCSNAKAKRIAEETLEKLLEDNKRWSSDSEKFFLAIALLRYYYAQEHSEKIKWEHYREIKERLRNKYKGGLPNETRTA